MIRSRSDLYTRTNQIIIDGSIFACSIAVAYALGFEGVPEWLYLKQFLLWLPYLLAARLFINWRLGIHRFSPPCISLFDAISIGRSLSVFTLLLLGLRLFYPPWAI